MESDSISQSDRPPQRSIRRYSPESERRRSFVLLRWLVVILASYLTLFSNLSHGRFALLFLFDATFAATNLFASLAGDAIFNRHTTRRALTLADTVFVLGTLYVLRVPNTYFYLAFGLVFVLAVVWRDLRLVLFAILSVSVLFGVFNAFRVAEFTLDVDIEKFLTLSLFFLVSIFYVFLSQQFDRDAQLSRNVLEDKRRAEALVEITRGVSSSLKTGEVLRVIVERLCEIVNASECAIFEIDSTTGGTLAMVRDAKQGSAATAVDFDAVPELREALEQRKMLFRHSADCSIAALPMISQEAVVGVIYIAVNNPDEAFSEDSLRFLEVVASTAANALRNARMFEEVERRARTDLMTGLANFQSFQTTLANELGRAERHRLSLSLLMVDLDYLKQVNDKFGHPSGDLVIRTVGEAILRNCRGCDFAARYGGEEFAVILPETSLEHALIVAERVRQKIAHLKFAGIGGVTASIGVANYPVNAFSKDDLIRVADQALYLAKHNGRNRAEGFRDQLVY